MRNPQRSAPSWPGRLAAKPPPLALAPWTASRPRTLLAKSRLATTDGGESPADRGGGSKWTETRSKIKTKHDARKLLGKLHSAARLSLRGSFAFEAEPLSVSENTTQKPVAPNVQKELAIEDHRHEYEQTT